MKKPLWTPSEQWTQNANVTHLIDQVNEKYGRNLKTYDDLYQWSVEVAGVGFQGGFRRRKQRRSHSRCGQRDH